MAQRLVRTLCPHCRKPAPPQETDPLAWDELVAPWKASRPERFMQAVGCLECRMTGYAGRIGIYEILLMSPEIKNLVASSADIALLREQAYREGMYPLRVSGALKIAQGVTTLEEVMKVAPPA
jgi:general secretion pathway protein E